MVKQRESAEAVFAALFKAQEAASAAAKASGNTVLINNTLSTFHAYRLLPLLTAWNCSEPCRFTSCAFEDMLFYRLPKTLVAWARNPTYNVCFDYDTTRNPRPILCLQGSCLLVGN